SIGVLSLVMWSPTMRLSVENETMVGAIGTCVSTVTPSAVEAALVIPATVFVAVKLWVALDKVPVTKLQAPLLLATAAPVSVRTFALVMPSPTSPLSGENEAKLGIGVFTVMAATDDAALV